MLKAVHLLSPPPLEGEMMKVTMEEKSSRCSRRGGGYHKDDWREKMSEEFARKIEEALREDRFVFKTSPALKQVDEDENVLWIRIFSKSLDRDKEVVLPESPLKHLDSYLANPVVLFAHQYRQPAVGKMVDYEVSEEEFVAKDKIAVDEYEFAATLFKLYAGGYMNAASAGFIPKKISKKKLFEGQVGPTYVEIEMLEHSLVTVPANREALKREWESLKGLDEALRPYVEKIIEAPLNYGCGHPVILDAEGEYPEDCPICREKGGEEKAEKDLSSLLSIWEPQRLGVTQIRGLTQQSAGHSHAYVLNIDRNGLIIGNTERLEIEATEEGELDLEKGVQEHIHFITEFGVTKPGGGDLHVHQLRLNLEGVKSVSEGRSEEEVEVQEKLEKSVVPFQDWPLADRGRPWDKRAAESRIRKWAKGEDGEVDFAKYRRAFVWYDSEKPENLTSYKLLICDVIDGNVRAVPRAIFAAGAVVQGARGGLDIPQSDLPRVKSHLAKYYRKMDMEPPWEREGKGIANLNFEELWALLREELVSELDSSEAKEEKEGRVLSEKNLRRIKQARDILTEVLDESERRVGGEEDKGKVIQGCLPGLLEMEKLVSEIELEFLEGRIMNLEGLKGER